MPQLSGRRPQRRLFRWHPATAPSTGTTFAAVAIAFAIVGAVIFESGILANTQDQQRASAARDRAAEYPQGPPAASGDALPPEAGAGGSPGGHTVPEALSAGAPLLSGGGSTPARNSFAIPRDPAWRAIAAVAVSPPATDSWRVIRMGAAVPAAKPPVKHPVKHPVAKPPVVRPPRPVTPPPPGSGWLIAPIVTWYGPGFYGRRTACGQRYTRTIIGVAHKTLPCGTLIEFRWGGITARARVIDRGPYATPDYVFDFSAALSCDVFRQPGVQNACFTRHNVQYRIIARRQN